MPQNFNNGHFRLDLFDFDLTIHLEIQRVQQIYSGCLRKL